MPRNGSGTMSISNSFVASTEIQSSPMNANFTDIASEITGSLPRDGQAGMTGQLKAANGTVSAPGVCWGSDTDTGFYRSATGSWAFTSDGTLTCTIGPAGLVTESGYEVSLASGGTGASLADPNADRILFWDDSGGASAWLSLSGLSISTTTLSVDAATDSAAGVVEKATQAEMEAETGDKYPDAALLKYHPGIAKAWWSFTGTGTVTLNADYGTTSVADSGTGDYEVTMDTAMSSINYAVPSGGAGSVGNLGVVGGATVPTTTVISQNTFHYNSGSANDIAYVTGAVFGDH